MRRVLITGGAGFIGSHLCRRLLNDGAEVAYWGQAWQADADGDGLSNLLDPDADDDGVLDGTEVALGFDPADPNSKP